MRPIKTLSALCLAAALLIGGLANAADAPPSTADVLNKLHASNLKEIEMGKLAESHGKSKGVKAFGKTLVQDHTAANKKVAALAKEENITLASAAPPKSDMPMDAGFDAAFARDMLSDHQKDIAEVKAAREATSDPKLKKLLSELLPVLEKHEKMAQKLVTETSKEAALKP